MRSCHLGSKQSCKAGRSGSGVTGPAGRRWTLAGIPGADAASHRDEWPGQWAACATSAGRAGRAKVRGPGHPCTRAKVQAREPGSGAGATRREGPGSPAACPRRPEPPTLRRRPARPPGTRPRSVAAAPLRAGHRQARAHLAPSERLCGSCTRGSGSGSGCPARRSGSERTRTTRAARVRRQDGLRTAPLPRRRHAPPRPSAGLRRAAAHPPRTGPGARPSFGPTSRQGRDQSFPRRRGCPPERGTGHQ